MKIHTRSGDPLFHVQLPDAPTLVIMFGKAWLSEEARVENALLADLNQVDSNVRPQALYGSALETPRRLRGDATFMPAIGWKPTHGSVEAPTWRHASACPIA